MNKLSVLFLAAFAVIAGCSGTTGPSVQGRWAAHGIELTARPTDADVRLPCGAAGHVSGFQYLNADGTIRFSTRVSGPGASYRIDFQGSLKSDTLHATMTSTFAMGQPLVHTYTMLPDGNPDFLSFYCLA
ncbi:MAG TPA: hypothetical protein VF864_04020 [Gemmatimonadales bacterium]